MNFVKLKRLIDRFVALKRLVVVILVIAAGLSLYIFLINFAFSNHNFAYGFVALWFLTAYLVLPRLHRLLTKLYLPNYYIGRARTSDGILGDPISLTVTGSKKQLIATMEKAGWQRAEELNFKTTFKMIRATLLGRSYPHAPVSSLILFDRKQDLAFQQEIGGSTSKRHHVRFWKTPTGWFLPGGYKTDWLGAATYDEKVGFSVYTFQFTHKIGEDTDKERDYVIKTMRAKSKSMSVQVVKNFSTSYHSRNGGGDSIKTDGSMPFVKL